MTLHPHQERLAFLTDRAMFATEAVYHAQVSMFRRWLDTANLAMEDEGVEPDVARRVLNRMVFGVPDADSAYHRRETQRRDIAELSKSAAPLFDVGLGRQL